MQNQPLKLSPAQSEKFRTLFSAYGDEMYALILKYTKDPHWTEDALQETLIKLTANIEKIGEPFSKTSRNYVLIVAKTTAIDTLRKKQRIEKHTVPLDDAKDILVSEEEAIEILAVQEINDFLWECVGKLSPDEQNLLELKYGQEFKEQEIAEILGVSYDAARQRISRMKRHLATLLQETKEGGDCDGKK